MPSEADKIKEERDHWRRLLRRREARIEELKDAKKKAETELRKKIKRRDEKREEGKGEQLADEVEELKFYIDRLEDRIADKRIEAKRFRRLFRKAKKAFKRAQKRARGKLSPNFHISEFHCRDGTKVPRAAKKALKAWCEQYGELMREKYGAVYVSSGYRTPSYNRQIGGASNSIHIYEYHPNAVAVDFVCERGTPAEWAAYGDSISVDGLGRYASFVHFDNRNRIGWATARWYG